MLGYIPLGNMFEWLRVMQFSQWLDFIERREVELHHGTTTGADNSRRQSFEKGIDPTRSSGYGQNTGYYAYSDETKAKQHAQSLLGPNSPKTFQQHAGKPMVVTHQAELNPRDYELDKEVQSQDLMKFFKSADDKINDMLEKNPVTVQPGEGGTFVVPQTLHGFFYHPGWNALGFWTVDTTAPGFDFQNAQEDKDYIVIQPNNVYDATDLHYIMQALFAQAPDLKRDYDRFQRSIMKATAKGKANPRAWKYVGQDTLTPSRISVEGE